MMVAFQVRHRGSDQLDCRCHVNDRLVSIIYHFTEDKHENNDLAYHITVGGTVDMRCGFVFIQLDIAFQRRVNLGGNEITIAGTGASDKNLDNSTWGLAGSYGWFVNNNWEVLLRQSVNFSDLPGDNSWSGSTRLGADYHWNLGKWRPFVGLNIGGIYGDGVNDSGIMGPDIGVKYYVKPDTFVFLQTEYQYFFDDSDDVTDNFSEGAFAHSVGVGFSF